jgi:dTDP-4-dehydrorhamnose 3,5-epimerase
MTMDIEGVKIKSLRSFPDDRGFFREIIRKTDDFFEESGFKQWSHSKMQKDVVKAWHYHHKQIDWWYIGLGLVEAVLYDNREESPTYKNKMVFKMGDHELGGQEICVKIPQGVLHGCKVQSDFAHLFYITSEIYDPNDEGRFPYNSEFVGHQWGENCIVVDNDRRAFVPKYDRARLAS